MKRLLYLLLFAASVAHAVEIAPQQDGTVFIKLSKEEVQSCMSEGGCVVVTQQGLLQLAAQLCGSKI